MTSRLTSAAALLLLLVALALHWRVALVTLNSSLWDGDPQRHYASGVMVFDYLRTALGTNPIRFAENFEVRYPEVAIGHWPPMYYAIQAIFYFIAGPTILSAQLLSAFTAAVLAALLFWKLRSATGMSIGLLSAAVFLAAPLVQTAAWQVMSDLLTGLFVFLAILAFSDFLEDTQSWKTAAAFAAWASAAILTKGSAWALGPFALLAPLLSRRFRCFRSIWYWCAGLAIVGCSAPFYLLVQRIGIGYPGNYSHIASPAVGLAERLSTLLPLIKFAPALLIVLSALGLAEAVHARWYGRDDSSWVTLSLASGAWIASQAIFLLVLPLTSEPRVFLPSLAPATILAARSMWWVKNALRRSPRLALAAPVTLAALIVVNAGPVPLQRLDGYREAADTMPYVKKGSLILVAADGLQEGAFIAERLSHERLHHDVILRGSHTLVQIDSAGNCRSLFPDADAVRNYLLQMPVRFVVLSNPPANCQAEEFIDNAVSKDSEDFHLVATVPILDRLRGENGELRIYENPAGRTRQPSIVRTPLGTDAGRRVLEYHWR